MAPPPRLRILSVGGNAISAFLSWRLQATNACDVTLVWKSGYDLVSQYGVTFNSKLLGNERFKPRHVVRTPEEAAARESAFDYVILCIKALPDVYDMGSVIESVVTPQHTCIIVNTTNTLGVESYLEQRYPTNVVLSLVSGIELTQMGASEFDHVNSTDVWVGTISKNTSIPSSIQNDMAEALAMTLSSGQINCKVSNNIRQEQFERVIGPIAFHPASVIFECPNHSQLLEKLGVRQLVSDVIDELLELATRQGCTFPADFRQTTIQKMITASEKTPQSTMFQDFQARRPMEVEIFLGSPMRLGADCGVRMPRVETLYAMLHHVNTVNQTKPRLADAAPPMTAHPPPPPRMSSAPPPQRPPLNAPMRASRTTSAMAGMLPSARRGPSMGGAAPRPSGVQQPSADGTLRREPSVEGLEEFSHVVLYDENAEAAPPAQIGSSGYADYSPGTPSAADLALRERELALRQRELQLREQEINMRRGGRRPASRRPEFDEEDEDDYVDPMEPMNVPHVDPDSVDMMSITARRNRKGPNPSQMRRNPEMSASGRPMSSISRYFGGRKRTSDRIIEEIPGLHESLMEHPMMAYSSNRYGSVDRNHLAAESRANSLTASRIGDYPPNSYPQSRRNSGSPASGFPGPGGRGMGRMGTPQDPNLGPPSGYFPPVLPSPSGNMRGPGPRYSPGHGNMLSPQPAEQPYPGKPSPQNRSLTGSASASADSGDSGASGNLELGNSAHSSQISLGAQAVPTPVR